MGVTYNVSLGYESRRRENAERLRDELARIQAEEFPALLQEALLYANVYRASHPKFPIELVVGIVRDWCQGKDPGAAVADDREIRLLATGGGDVRVAKEMHRKAVVVFLLRWAACQGINLSVNAL